MGTENGCTIHKKKSKKISDSVFTFLFGDLVESEKIKLYMDEVTQRVYEEKMEPDELRKSLSELTDRYVMDEMNPADQASVIRYISAFAKIENNVKANLRIMRFRERHRGLEQEKLNEAIRKIICQYQGTQKVMNEWVRQYAAQRGLRPEWVATPDLEWIDKEE